MVCIVTWCLHLPDYHSTVLHSFHQKGEALMSNAEAIHWVLLLQLRTKLCHQQMPEYIWYCVCGLLCIRRCKLTHAYTEEQDRELKPCWNTLVHHLNHKHNDSSVWLMSGVIMKCLLLNVCQLEAENVRPCVRREMYSVAVCVWGGEVWAMLMGGGLLQQKNSKVCSH